MGRLFSRRAVWKAAEEMAAKAGATKGKLPRGALKPEPQQRWFVPPEQRMRPRRYKKCPKCGHRVYFN
jgi:hypothetical protein